MPEPLRRLWDSSVVIGYLAGDAGLEPHCSQIIGQAEAGGLEIVVSEMAKVETAYLKELPDAESALLIREFFSREYIIPVSLDDPVSAIAQDLVRKYRTPPILRPPDAVHLATAILWRIPILETTDSDLLRLDQREGDPLITIRRPLYQGPLRLPESS